MIDINSSNIDKWLFDYAENELSAIEKLNVDAFIERNPEFKADFDAWNDAHISPKVPVLLSPAYKKSLTKSQGFLNRFTVISGVIFVAVCGLIGYQMFEPKQPAFVEAQQKHQEKRVVTQALLTTKLGEPVKQEVIAPSLKPMRNVELETDCETLTHEILELEATRKVAEMKEYQMLSSMKVASVKIRTPRTSHKKRKLTFRERRIYWKETRGKDPVIVQMDSDLF